MLTVNSSPAKCEKWTLSRSDRQCDPITVIVAHHVVLADAQMGAVREPTVYPVANTLCVAGYVTVSGGIAFRPI
jgi:hypothetical protein